MRVLLGTSGWQYKDWRKSFYPEKLAQRLWLSFYTERFQTVEVNNSFYRLPPPETFAAWAAGTPDDFVVVPKMSRYLTHIKRLRDPEEPVERFLRHAEPLGSKMGPILVQLPPTLKADLELLKRCLALFPAGVRVAVEFRHETWFNEDTMAVLREFNAAHCLADREATVLGPVERTADWLYLRLHEGVADPSPCYSDEDLDEWVRRLVELEDGVTESFVYFNNDPNCCAVENAITFAELCAKHGLDVSRTPEHHEVDVGAYYR